MGAARQAQKKAEHLEKKEANQKAKADRLENKKEAAALAAPRQAPPPVPEVGKESNSVSLSDGIDMHAERMKWLKEQLSPKA